MTAVASSDLANFLAQKLSNYVEADQVGQLADVLSQGITEYQSQSGKKGSKRKSSTSTTRPKKFKALTPYHQFVACWMLQQQPSVSDGTGNGKTQSQERMTAVGADWKVLPDASRSEFAVYATRYNEYVERAVSGRSFDSVPKAERDSIYDGAATYAYEGSRFSSLLHAKRERDATALANKKSASSTTASATTASTSAPTSAPAPSASHVTATAPVAHVQAPAPVPVPTPVATTVAPTRRGAGRR